MTREEFKQLPHLVAALDVLLLGYSPATVDKYVACGVLEKIKPAGIRHARFQKKQLAQLLRWEDLLGRDDFRREPPLLTMKAMVRWTGFAENTITQIAKAGGLTMVKPPGAGKAKYLKEDVAKLIGFEELV